MSQVRHTGDHRHGEARGSNRLMDEPDLHGELPRVSRGRRAGDRRGRLTNGRVDASPSDCPGTQPDVGLRSRSRTLSANSKVNQHNRKLLRRQKTAIELRGLLGSPLIDSGEQLSLRSVLDAYLGRADGPQRAVKLLSLVRQMNDLERLDLKDGQLVNGVLSKHLHGSFSENQDSTRHNGRQRAKGSGCLSSFDIETSDLAEDDAAEDSKLAPDQTDGRADRLLPKRSTGSGAADSMGHETSSSLPDLVSGDLQIERDERATGLDRADRPKSSVGTNHIRNMIKSRQQQAVDLILRQSQSKSPTLEPNNKRPIATYLKRNSRHSEIVWRTELADDSTDDDSGSDMSYSDFFDPSGGQTRNRSASLNVGDRFRPQTDSLRPPPANCRRPQEKATMVTTTSANGHRTTHLVGTKSHSGASGLEQPVCNVRSSFSDQRISRPAGSKPSSTSTALTDLFDDELNSSASKIKLTSQGSRTSNQDRQSHLSLDNFKLLVERNLVAALIGLYFLVSLTVMVVLILPYTLDLSRDSDQGDSSHLLAGSMRRSQKVQSVQDYLLLEPAPAASSGAPMEPDKGSHSRDVTRIGDREDRPKRPAQSPQRPQAQLAGNKVSEIVARPGPGHLVHAAAGGVGRQPPVATSPKTEPPNRRKGTRQMSRPTPSPTGRRANEQLLEAWSTTHRQQCQPLKVPSCSKTLQSMISGASAAVGSSPGQLAYDKTLLPNQFSQSRQSQVEKVLQKYEPIIDIKCYPLMPLFLCSIYAPKCISLNETSAKGSAGEQHPHQAPPSLDQQDEADLQGPESQYVGSILASVKGQPRGSSGDHLSRLVPPCRSLCREALRRCTFFFEVLSLQLLELDDCEALPESADPNVCIGQTEHSLFRATIDAQTCGEDKFRCMDGECIAKKWQCDGYADCTDKSDELKCSKCDAASQFYCGQDICIDKEQVCDGIRNCKDGRDERQCLRLADSAGSPANKLRRLEVWSAVKNDWLAVCGAHWSAMPMSHDACHALGYSRANQTLILYGPMGHQQQQLAGGRAANETAARLQQRPTPASWLDVTFGASLTSDEPDEGEQTAALVEDMVSDGSSAGSAKAARAGRADHLVTYERELLPGQTGRVSADLALVDAAETKLRSVSSMLYLGAQARCEGQPAHLASSVHLQCQNFQCGRSVSSHSTRVRQQSPRSGAAAGPSGARGGAPVGRLRTLVAHEEPAAPAEQAAASARLVVGGFESMPGEFPYLAALHGGPDEVFFCGGVLIGINWLLTAAHCVGNRTRPDGWMVKVGVTRRIASPAFVRKLRVRKIVKHPDFNQDSLFNNDIALILLEQSVEFHQYLRPICLPRANALLGPDNSKDCVVVGFGKSRFSQDANYLHVAHFVNVPIVHHSVCSSWYAEHGVNLTEGMLCAGYAEGKRDACQGDSGSGLFCRYSNTNQFFVAGVVSFGIKCATPKLPGVYTSVPRYVDWIKAATGQHGYALA